MLRNAVCASPGATDPQGNIPVALSTRDETGIATD